MIGPDLMARIFSKAIDYHDKEVTRLLNKSIKRRLFFMRSGGKKSYIIINKDTPYIPELYSKTPVSQKQIFLNPFTRS